MFLVQSCISALGVAQPTMALPTKALFPTGFWKGRARQAEVQWDADTEALLKFHYYEAFYSVPILWSTI